MPAAAPPVAPQHTSYMTLEAGFDSEADADAGTALRAPAGFTSSPARCKTPEPSVKMVWSDMRAGFAVVVAHTLE